MIKNKLAKQLPLLIIFGYGFTSSILQLNFLRITSFVFSGNEISFNIILGHWLLFTALGSYAGARFKKGRMTFLIFLYAFFAILFYWLIYFSRQIFGINNFIHIGNDVIFVISLILICLPTFLNGFLFPSITQKIITLNPAIKINQIYGLELFGAAVGSLSVAILTFFSINPYYLLIFSICSYILIIIHILCQCKLKNIFYYLILVFVFLFLIKLVPLLSDKFYPHFKLDKKAITPAGTITLLKHETITDIYSDNIFLWNSEDIQRNEELIHFAMSLHSSPKAILVLGNINPLLIRELDKYESVDSVSFFGNNKILYDLFSSHFPDYNFTLLPRVGDPYQLVKKCRRKFDVILLNIPPPTNLKWNRYYTVEFFQKIDRLMKPMALFDFTLSGSETFLTSSQLDFLQTIKNSLSSVFPSITMIPGNTIHFISRIENLTIDLENFRVKPKDTEYINSAYLSDRLSAFKINFLKEKFKNKRHDRSNHLFKPIGFYYSTLLQGDQTNSQLSNIYRFLYTQSPLFLYGLIFIVAVFSILTKQKSKIIRNYMIFFGFFVMCEESILILLYQSISGAVYLRIALVIFLFMLGAGISALTLRRFRIPFKTLLILATIINLIAFLIIYCNDLVIFINFIIFLTGFISGRILPVLHNQLQHVSNQYCVNSGRLYAWEVFGGSFGLYFYSIIVIPIWGFKPALISIQILLIAFTGLTFLTITKNENG